VTAGSDQGREGGGSAPLVLGVAAGAVVAVAVAFFGIGALIDSGADGGVTGVGDVRTGKLSAERYAAVEPGTPKEEVLASLRPLQPVDVQILDRYESRSPETVATSCVYFDSEGVRPGAQYRFCFDEDVLVDKTVVLPERE
jgi:hypothetical protein